MLGLVPSPGEGHTRQKAWLAAVRACKRAWDSWDSLATRGSSLPPASGDRGSWTCDSGGSRPVQEEESFRSAHAGWDWGGAPWLRAPLCSPPPPAGSPLPAPPARVPRAPPLCDSLTSQQVGPGACEPSRAGLTARLQPAPPQLGRSAPPPEPALAATWPSHPRHARLQLVQGRCGINFPEATSPPEEVDRQLCIYTRSAASGCAPRGPVRRTADSCGTLAFE